MLAEFPEWRDRVLSGMRGAIAEIEVGDAAPPIDSRDKIAIARSFVDKSHVGEAALAIYDTVRFYPSWCTHSGWSKWNLIGVSDIDGRTDGNPTSTGFRWRGRKWLFMLENRGASYSGTETLGRFSVAVDGHLTMELAVANAHRDGVSWYSTDVNALTAGNWVIELIEMYLELKLAQYTQRARDDSMRLERQASRINL